MDFETRQQTMKNLLTCGICGKLSREVTVIEECCHTFCWKCIFQKITRGKCHNCPQCNADLGGAPLLKIKTDYKWQSMRDNFNNIRQKLIDYGLMKPRAKDLNKASNQARNDAEPSDGKGKGKGKEHEASLLDEATPEEVAHDREDKGKELEVLGQAPELAPRDVKGKGKLVIKPHNEDSYSSIPLPVPMMRKKRSITALVDPNGTSNRTPAPRAGRGRRKAFARKFTRPGSVSSSDLEETDSDEDYFISPRNRGRISKVAKIKEQCTYVLEPGPLNEKMPHEPLYGMNEPLKALEGASKSNPENYAAVQECESNGNGQTNMASGSTKRRRGRRKKEEKQVVDDHHDQDPTINDHTEKRVLAEDLNIPTHIVIDPATVYRRTQPIWFQLVASNMQENCGTLPALPPCYIQVKDINMPASFIKKYLVTKLGLGSEDELEIRMRGEPVHPDTQIHQLVELWVQTATRSESKKGAAVGGSGKDFVMVFAYSWSSGGAQF